MKLPLLRRGRYPRVTSLLALVGALFFNTASEAQTLAFPGAEGFGRFSQGGRGGAVYIVTNLNDSGPGSLREACSASGPRTVVFAVSGTIYLQSTLRILNGDLTIAGQTAPGDGICVANYPIDPSNSHDVVIRFLRSRLGDTSGLENDAFSCRYADNIIVDHCSFSWSVDESASAYDNTHFTLQWCIISESLRDSVHSKGAHGYGGIWGGLGASFHHNLLAHHDSRNPRLNGARYHGTDGEMVDLRNNVIYNWRGNSCYGGEPTDTGIPSHQNLINNYYKYGPATGSGSIRYRILNPSSLNGYYGLFHVEGNYTTASSSVSGNNWNGGVQGPSSTELAAMKVDTPFDVAPVITQTAQGAFPLVLDYAGCRLPNRDSVDSRIVNEVATGTVTYYGSKNNIPGIIDSQADVGGWPELVSTTAPVDSDSDGMPDDWENSHGLNPNDPSDRNQTLESGYTQLEVYLNSLATTAYPVPQITTQPQSATIAAGEPITLSVVATGSEPFSYVWFKNNVIIPDATGSTYEISSSSTTDSGSYSVEITNDYGTTPSEAANITVGVVAPSITSSPADQTVIAGHSATFAVSVFGSTPLTYQWYHENGSPVPNADSATLTLTSVTQADAGSYYVVVKNDSGTATSQSATLTVVVSSSETVYSSDLTQDTIHADTPVITGASTNWYVMSSKNATTTTVGDDPSTSGTVETRPLDITMSLTSSGVTEAAALLSQSPLELQDIGDSVEAQIVFQPHNVRTLGVGLFNSAGVLPYTGLINGQLANSKTNYATGGTQHWTGYRFVAYAGSATPNIDARLAQSGADNSSQSLIVPGTSSSASNVVSVGSITNSDNALNLTDDTTYTLTLNISLSGENEYSFAFDVFQGEGTGSNPVFSSTGVSNNASALPGSVATAFDAIGIGYRNLDGNSVSHLMITSLALTHHFSATTTDAYTTFLVDHGLDAATDGAINADPDGDGLTNALEFILGGNPTDASSAPQPQLNANPTSGWDFSYSENINAGTLFNIVAEQSGNLIDWTEIHDGVDGASYQSTAGENGFNTVVVHFNTTLPRFFVRLKASTP